MFVLKRAISALIACWLVLLYLSETTGLATPSSLDLLTSLTVNSLGSDIEQRCATYETTLRQGDRQPTPPGQGALFSKIVSESNSANRAQTRDEQRVLADLKECLERLAPVANNAEQKSSAGKSAQGGESVVFDRTDLINLSRVNQESKTLSLESRCSVFDEALRDIYERLSPALATASKPDVFQQTIRMLSSRTLPFGNSQPVLSALKECVNKLHGYSNDGKDSRSVIAGPLPGARRDPRPQSDPMEEAHAEFNSVKDRKKDFGQDLYRKPEQSTSTSSSVSSSSSSTASSANIANSYGRSSNGVTTNGGIANGGTTNGGISNGGATNGGGQYGGATNGGGQYGYATNSGITNGGIANGVTINGGIANRGTTNGDTTNGGIANGGATNGGVQYGGITNGGSPYGGSATNGGGINHGQAGNGAISNANLAPPQRKQTPTTSNSASTGASTNTNQQDPNGIASKLAQLQSTQEQLIRQHSSDSEQLRKLEQELARERGIAQEKDRNIYELNTRLNEASQENSIYSKQLHEIERQLMNQQRLTMDRDNEINELSERLHEAEQAAGGYRQDDEPPSSSPDHNRQWGSYGHESSYGAEPELNYNSQPGSDYPMAVQSDEQAQLASAARELVEEIQLQAQDFKQDLGHMLGQLAPESPKSQTPLERVRAEKTRLVNKRAEDFQNLLNAQLEAVLGNIVALEASQKSRKEAPTSSSNEYIYVDNDDDDDDDDDESDEDYSLKTKDATKQAKIDKKLTKEEVMGGKVYKDPVDIARKLQDKMNAQELPAHRCQKYFMALNYPGKVTKQVIKNVAKLSLPLTINNDLDYYNNLNDFVPILAASKHKNAKLAASELENCLAEHEHGPNGGNQSGASGFGLNFHQPLAPTAPQVGPTTPRGPNEIPVIINNNQRQDVDYHYHTHQWPAVPVQHKIFSDSGAQRFGQTGFDGQLNRDPFSGEVVPGQRVTKNWSYSSSNARARARMNSEHTFVPMSTYDV